MDTPILIIGGILALGAFLLGSVLLVMYLRSNRSARSYRAEPMIYGNLIGCPNCGYVNPPDAAACLRCRAPLAVRPPAPFPPPPADYKPYSYAPSVPAPDYHRSSTPDPGYTVSRAEPGGYAPHQYAPAQPEYPGATHAASPAPSPAAPNYAPETYTLPEQPSVPGMPRAWLEGVGGAFLGHQAVLTQASTLIGRSTQCDVQLYDPKVSRRHFMIRFANGAFFLQDQQSSRGTRINGERVMARRLNDGDRIDVGDSSLIFHTEQ